MNVFTLKLCNIDDKCQNLVGGKASCTARIASNGIKVPESLCITIRAFEAFIHNEGLHDKILMEYHRKSFEDMRWEEIWDLSLRIKNLFLNTRYPSELLEQLTASIKNTLGNTPVVVRSSAIGEDSAKYSFAGIHESYVNVVGTDSILNHIKLVWASLFSDSAILYKQETGLDIRYSKMAVLIQKLVNGQKSGVAFGQSPSDKSQMMIEAVHGLNQGLVDGTVEPDRWLLNRTNGKIISYTPAIRDKVIKPDTSGVRVSGLVDSLSNKAPLSGRELNIVYCLCKELRSVFGRAQDVEWTFLKRTLYCLQSRPITTMSSDDEGTERQWYLSLKRSLDNLKQLRMEIESTLIPEMKAVGESLESMNLSLLSSDQLVDELKRRKTIVDKWRDIYWDKFIPFAHAVRIFGEIYNKQIQPSDPYEFTQLLVSTELKSLERNRMLENLAEMYSVIQSKIQGNNKEIKSNKVVFDKKLKEFLEKYRNPIWGLDTSGSYRKAILKLLKHMAERPTKTFSSRRFPKKLETDFLNSFSSDNKNDALELLNLARISYQLRDDDNIYLGKIESQLYDALSESNKRTGHRLEYDMKHLNIEEAIKALKNPSYEPSVNNEKHKNNKKFAILARQLTGQPAGEGLAIGKARVVKGSEDLFEFKSGEILVCDSIDPNMTFVVPLAGGIVERRGGMLIHGAMIAREYGLPCITGVADAADIIENGQEITVDGYLGIVTINT